MMRLQYSQNSGARLRVWERASELSLTAAALVFLAVYEQPVRWVAVSLAFDQLVVDLDERRPDPLFGDAQSSA